MYQCGFKCAIVCARKCWKRLLKHYCNVWYWKTSGRFVVMMQHMLQYWHNFKCESFSKWRPHFEFHLLLHDAWRMFPLQDSVFVFSADLYSYVNVWKAPFYRALQIMAHTEFRTFFPQSLACWLEVNCGEQAVGWLCSQSGSSVVLMSQCERNSMRKSSRGTLNNTASCFIDLV